MATYLLYAWPTVALSIGLGLALGWLTWGRGRRAALRAHRDAVRRIHDQHDRDLAERDATVEILRDELASEASEAARLRRMLGRTPPTPSTRREPPHNASVLAVAAARTSVNGHGAGESRDQMPVEPVVGRRALRRSARS